MWRRAQQAEGIDIHVRALPRSRATNDDFARLAEVKPKAKAKAQAKARELLDARMRMMDVISVMARGAAAMLSSHYLFPCIYLHR